MTEWSIVGVIIALVGLITAIVTPIVKMTKAMTRLTVVMEHTEQQLATLTSENTASHGRIWKHNEEQDASINNHEMRIGILEHEKAI